MSEQLKSSPSGARSGGLKLASGKIRGGGGVKSPQDLLIGASSIGSLPPYE